MADVTLESTEEIIQLVSVSGASQGDITTAVNAHSALTTGVHGVGASTVDSTADRNTAISAHNALATAHGLTANISAALSGAASPSAGNPFLTATASATFMGDNVFKAPVTIGGVGTAVYTEFLLKIYGNNHDAGILLDPYANNSAFIDFIDERHTAGAKGRIGRNPFSVGSALFIGYGGDVSNSLQIGQRDVSPMQFFTADTSRMIISSTGSFGFGATVAPLTFADFKLATNLHFLLRPGTDYGYSGGIVLDSRSDTDTVTNPIILHGAPVSMTGDISMGTATVSPYTGLYIYNTAFIAETTGHALSLRLKSGDSHWAIGVNPVSSTGNGHFGIYQDDWFQLPALTIGWKTLNTMLGTTTDGMTAGGSLAIAQDLAHRGTKVGFYNTGPVVQQVLATGVGATADNIISFLQAIGLCKQA